MRDALPRSSPWENESAVVNLYDTAGPGMHCVCYKKRGDMVLYFDGFGNLRPPVELIRYFGSSVTDVRCNYARKQPPDTIVCGHIGLELLSSNDQ